MSDVGFSGVANYAPVTSATANREMAVSGLGGSGVCTIGPALALNFLVPPTGTAVTLDSRITFTRASSGTYFDSTGTLKTATTDVPRFDYNPSTLAPLGLLIEEARTNSIRNNTGAGGSAGVLPTNWVTTFSIDGLTLTIGAPSTESGISYVDLRLNGTTTTGRTNIALVSFEPGNSVAAASGQAWTNSCYTKLSAGSLTNVTSIGIQLSERDSSGNYLTDSTTLFVPTTAGLATQRQSVTRTLNNASTAYVRPTIVVSYSSGVAIDVTIRVGLPQLEQGAFATSVIATSTTALSRSADVPTISGTNFSSWFNQTQGTFYIEYQGVNNVAGGTRRAVEIGVSGSTAERYVIGYIATTSSRVLVIDGGVTQADVSVTSTQSNIVKLAASYILNNIAQATNGTSGTTDTAATLPTVDQLWFGAAEGSTANTVLNGYIRSFIYYPKQLPAFELRMLTA